MIDLIRVPDPTCIDDLLDEPLGLLYLGASLKREGHDVRITNLAGHNFNNWKSKIKKADLYGIQLFTPTAHIGINIAKFIKENFNKPIICGGAHPTALPKSKDLMIFDNVIVGEAEEAIVKVANAYRNKKILPRIIEREFIEDLDSLPFPARDLVDIMAFHRKIDGNRAFGIVGSRGCNYRCAFCDHGSFGEKVRFRSIDNLVEEIEQIISEFGVRHLEFFDDMFTVNKKRLSDFKDRVGNLNIIYRCDGRSDVLDKEVYNLLYKSGCKMICFGIESGSQKILNLMRKGTKVEQNLEAIKMTQEAGIYVTGYFILGFPGETKQTIQQTKDFIIKSDIDQAQVYTFIPLPGCEVCKHPERFNIKISKDFPNYFLVTGKYGRGGKVIDTEYLTADELQEEVTDFRKFLKDRGSRGDMQDYYKKIGYKTK